MAAAQVGGGVGGEGGTHREGVPYWLPGMPYAARAWGAASRHAVEGEVVDPGTSARSRHNVLVCRSGAPAAEQPRINGMALWPVGNLLWPILGALAYSTA